MMADMPLNKVLERVRKLIARAEAPIAAGATPSERAAELIQQETARKMADDLMLEYAIREAELDKTRPASSQNKPATIEVSTSGEEGLVGYVTRLAMEVAEHCRCLIRPYSRYDRVDGTYMAKVYGYESDLRYFEILYTTLRLHMVGALSARPDTSLSLEDDVYRLHNAGLNWWDIAEAFGWKGPVASRPGEPKLMYRNSGTGERASWSKAVNVYKRAYLRAITARGEEPVRIPPTGSEAFRRSSLQGYISQMWTRLSELRTGRKGTGSALVLRSESLDAFFRQENPDMFEDSEPAPECEACKKAKSGHCRQHPKGSFRSRPFSRAGYLSGVAYANTASLSPEAGSSSAPAIPSSS